LQGGVYKSLDKGEHWVSVTNKLSGLKGSKQGTDYTFVTDPENPDILYVAPRNCNHVLGLYKTLDLGKNWRRIAEKHNVTYGWSRPGGQFFQLGKRLSICDSDPKVIYEGGAYAIHKSVDGGNAWEQIYADETKPDCWKTRGADAVHVYDIDISGKDNEIVYITADDAGIWKSTDAGSSYKCIAQRWNVFSLTVDPGAPDVLYMGESKKSGSDPGIIKKSIDGGKTWQSFLDDTNGADHDASWRWKIIVDPSSPAEKRIIYAVNGYWYKRNGTGIYRTIDGGKQWKRINNGLDNLNINDLIIDRDNKDILYAVAGIPGKNMGVYESGYNGPPGGVYKSIDRGDSWRKLNVDIEIPNCIEMAQDPCDPSVFYISAAMFCNGRKVYPGGVFRSLDGGRTWSLSLKQACVSSVAVDKNTGAVYASSTVSSLGVNLLPHRATDAKTGIFRSLDKGNTWRDVTGNLKKVSTSLYFICLDPRAKGALYVSSSAGCVRGVDKKASE